MNSSAEQPCFVKASWIASFTRSEVSGSPSTTQRAVRLLGSAEEVARGVHARLGGALRAADAGELALVLDAAAAVEELALRSQLDAVRAQVLGELSGNVCGRSPW